jgi:hypothetical protein
MPKAKPAGVGRKRPQLNIAIENLHLDPANPRLPEEIQGKSEPEVLEHLFRKFDLEEIADPMGKNGYFDEEPLIAIPNDIPAKLVPKPGKLESDAYLEFINKKTTQFTVVEGNRRLSTAKILRDSGLRQEFKIRSWPEITDAVRDDLAVLPVIIYPTRKEVLPYLGVRHITGIKKWDSYAKARYIADMIDDGHTIENIEKQVGDRVQSVRKNAIGYHLLKQAREELDWDIANARNDFSLLILSIGQKNIKAYLGWTKIVPQTSKTKTTPLDEIELDSPVDEEHLPNLRNLLSWLFGEGSKVLPVIKESRNITDYLQHVVASPQAIEYLQDTRNLVEAYDLTDGEELMLRKLLKLANLKLEKALGVAHRHKTPDVVAEAEKCSETAGLLVKAVKE